jgi:environmental stress-induced protein Ves
VSIQRFDLNEIAAQPWKNGAGTTREIARDGPPETFNWRLSLAQVEHDAPFSAYRGIDRCIVLMSGAGMQLRADDGGIDHRLDAPLVPFHFSGDAALTATLIDGASSDFNVMTRRGAFRSEVTCHRAGVNLERAHVVLLLCSAGHWIMHLGGSHELSPMQALLVRAPPAAIAIYPMAPTSSAALLSVRLCQDRFA